MRKALIPLAIASIVSISPEVADIIFNDFASLIGDISGGEDEIL